MYESEVSPSAVVRSLITAIEHKDLAQVADLLAENISYENMPMKPIVGKPIVLKVLQGFLDPAEAVEWQVLSECERGNTVYNERLDRFKINGGWLDLPIAGVFRVEAGKITLWRDYFDMATYTERLKQLKST
jgi:limonene-1,2-epoxide hydrolase